MRARKNAAAEAGENERGSAPHRCVCAHRHAQPPRGTQRVALGASKRRRARSHRFRTRATAVIVCAFTGNMCPGKKRVDQACVCEGLDENSWQSRPRHAVLSPTPGRLPPRGTTAADLARVMLLLDASTIAKNVGRRLLFAGSRRAARSHSDLGGRADGTTSAADSKTLCLARVCLGLDYHEFSTAPSHTKACKRLVVDASAHAPA